MTVEAPLINEDNESSDTRHSKKDDQQNTKSGILEFRIALVTSVCAIAGVLIGAFITGYFSVQTQKIMAKQQSAVFEKQIAQGERQELKKILTDYAEVITEYYQLVTSEKLTSNVVDKFAAKAYKNAFYITIVISIDLGQKTFEMNQVLLENLKLKHENKYTDALESKTISKFAEWFLIAKGELKLLEYKVSPDNMSSDLIRLLLRGGLSNNEKSK